MPPDSSVRVLVVEDEPDYRDLVASSLRRRGFEVIEIANGLQALQFVESSFEPDSAVAPPDVIVTDLRMPKCEGMDVIAYTRRLRGVPTILLTAFGTPEAFEEARALGAARCLSKPVDLDALCDAVAQVAGEALAARPTPPPAS